MLLSGMSLSTYIRRARIAALLAAALWIPAAALSQETTPTEEPALEPPEIQAIPLEDVQDQAAAVSAELETALPGEALRKSLEKISSKLERLKEDTRFARRASRPPPLPKEPASRASRSWSCSSPAC